jgi:hypothetical protein
MKLHGREHNAERDEEFNVVYQMEQALEHILLINDEEKK